MTIDFDDLTVEDVSRTFGRRRALSRISFRATRGAILGLLGPNGAGKSTLISLLATLLRPSGGAIRYGSYDAAAHGVALRAAIGVLGHDLFLYPELTARELIHNPRLVLLDEPFTGLDDASAAALIARLRSLRDGGAIVVLATHDLDLAEGLLDHAIFLRDGRMVHSVERPEQLRVTYRS